MRYKKTQIIHQVVIDEEVEDVASVKKLLDNICESYIDVSIKYFVTETESTVLWKKVRVISVEDETASIKVFSGNYISNSEIKIANIKFVGIVTDRSGILSNKSKVTAYDFLDLSDK